MSTTAPTLDARGALAGWLMGLHGMYAADINAIPDDKWNATFGGCTRPASELTGDCVAILDWVTNAMKGNVDPNFDETSMSPFVERCKTKAGAQACLKENCEAFSAALNACSEEDLMRVVTPPWKMDAPLFLLAHVAVSHVWYHDGQLNYVQCLLGDNKIHWMGD